MPPDSTYLVTRAMSSPCHTHDHFPAWVRRQGAMFNGNRGHSTLRDLAQWSVSVKYLARKLASTSILDDSEEMHSY